ncbi:MAG: hypothetical protein ACK4ND_05395 [Cytophagaceae bacterium]
MEAYRYFKGWLNLLILIGFLAFPSFAQDTIRLHAKPILQIQKWPDLVPVSKLKPGESSLIFTNITVLPYSDVDLVNTKGLVDVKEDDVKSNLFLITPKSELKMQEEIKVIELEVWVKLGDKEVYYPCPRNSGLSIYDKNLNLYHPNVQWINLREKYEVKGDRILLTTLSIVLEK